MRVVYVIASLGAALVCLFFTSYTVRLLIVSRFLTLTREGGGGMYIGAIAFPIAAICAGLFARWAWRRSRTAT